MKRAVELEKAIQHWGYVAPIVAYPKNDKELDVLSANLAVLLDKVGDNEAHPLMRLIDIISELISSYEEEHCPMPVGTAIDSLKYLMQVNHLQQKDLLEIGSQGVVSEILGGKRPLNLRQVKQLAKRFGVNPATFIDDE